MKLFATYGQPEILHSAQGRNFESAICVRPWMHLASSHAPQPTSHKEMVVRDWTLCMQLVSCCVLYHFIAGCVYCVMYHFIAAVCIASSCPNQLVPVL